MVSNLLSHSLTGEARAMVVIHSRQKEQSHDPTSSTSGRAQELTRGLLREKLCKRNIVCVCVCVGESENASS